MNSKTDLKSPDRRDVSYQSLDDLLTDLELVSDENYVTVGNLTKGQIFKHLADAFRSSMDGFPPDLKAPWIARKIIGPLLKNRLIHKKMKAGFRIPKSSADYHPDRQDFPEAESFEEFTSMVKRFQNEGGDAIHPFIGKLTPEEWKLLHLRHSELHMSFLNQTRQP